MLLDNDAEYSGDERSYKLHNQNKRTTDPLKSAHAQARYIRGEDPDTVPSSPDIIDKRRLIQPLKTFQNRTAKKKWLVRNMASDDDSTETFEGMNNLKMNKEMMEKME